MWSNQSQISNVLYSEKSPSSRCGLLEPPVLGSFSDGIGVFEYDDTFDGRPIVVRYVWSGITTTTARWQQSFSDDGGATWETNSTVEHSRPDDGM